MTKTTESKSLDTSKMTKKQLIALLETKNTIIENSIKVKKEFSEIFLNKDCSTIYKFKSLNATMNYFESNAFELCLAMNKANDKKMTLATFNKMLVSALREKFL